MQLAMIRMCSAIKLSARKLQSVRAVLRDIERPWRGSRGQDEKVRSTLAKKDEYIARSYEE